MSRREILLPWDSQPQEAVRVNWAHPLASGLAFLAPLNPETGLADLVSGQIPTITGAITAEANRYGKFLNFGSGKRLDFASTPKSITPATPCTIAWTQEPISPSTSSTILNAQFGVAGSDRPLVIYQSSNASFRFLAGPSSALGAHQWLAAGSPVDRQRDAFVLVAANSISSTTSADWALYKNGALVMQSGRTNFAASTLGGFRIGALLTGSDPWEGLIGDLTMWARVLDADEAARWCEDVNILYEPRRIWVPVSAGGGGAATVTPTIITSTASFGSAAVARTAVAAITTTRIESTASIGAHVVSAAGVAAISATRIASAVSFGTATVARTAVAAVSPTRIASTASIGAHVVTVAGMGAVSAARIESTVSFGAATVTRSAVHSIQPGRIDSSVTFGVPVVTSSTPQIFVGRIASTAAVYAPPVVRTGPVVAASEYRRFSSAFATSRTLASAITQTVTLASAIDLE